jgi:hypothetical protein
MLLTEICEVGRNCKKGREVDDALRAKRNKTPNPGIICSSLANLA